MSLTDALGGGLKGSSPAAPRQISDRERYSDQVSRAFMKAVQQDAAQQDAMKEAKGPRGLGIGVGNIAHPCARRLWYDVRWAARGQGGRPRGVSYRMMDYGVWGEARIIKGLRLMGMDVRDVDPATGEQWRILGLGGWVRGYGDGVIESGVPGHAAVRHILEVKTTNSQKFKQLRLQGLADANEWHHGQAQIGGWLLGCQRLLYICECRDTQQVYVENLPIDPELCDRLIGRAADVVSNDTPPERLPIRKRGLCRYCPSEPVCIGGSPATISCRTCHHGKRELGARIRCTKDDAVVERSVEVQGCPDWQAAEWTGCSEDIHSVVERWAP